MTTRQIELARIAAAVTDEEQSNPEIAQEMRDWAATTGDGMEDLAVNEKP